MKLKYRIITSMDRIFYRSSLDDIVQEFTLSEISASGITILANGVVIGEINIKTFIYEVRCKRD